MSACQFTITISQDPATILDKAKKLMESQGGTMNGDVNSGSFEVSFMSNEVNGSYKVNGQELELTINKKPMFIPCNAIESYLKSKLS